MEYFTADFLQFSTEKRQNMAFNWSAGYLSSNPSIPQIFLKVPNLLRSYILSPSTTREATRTFTLW